MRRLPSRPMPRSDLFCHTSRRITRRPVACDSFLVRTAIICFMCQSFTTASGQRSFAVRSHRAVAESSWQSARMRVKSTTDLRVYFERVVRRTFSDNARQSPVGTSATSGAASAEADSGQPWRERPAGARLGSDSAPRRGVVHATVSHIPTPDGRHSAPPFPRASDASDCRSRFFTR
jgi:hypothetical protein